MAARGPIPVADVDWLIQQPPFQRVIFEIYRTSGITRFTREEQARLFSEGKRSLGLEILGWFSATPGEPDDAIAMAIDAGKQFTPPKGTKHDDRD
ncbi:hypothetical protein CVO77_00265 [Sphingopyxis lindanitolerans]|uniref:Uncharacterized protein n=1 Tax=Sphingopyxis lindanitolerans TaxID=2054227 RepID=A0A2S8BAN2_9SPHN|nr:hypothetical protein [Sphingopyxis lindanitolerans]PQM29408.1 hypothetical protein CVO77_00265 [Sphingopyxis lindanitolerans]